MRIFGRPARARWPARPGCRRRPGPPRWRAVAAPGGRLFCSGLPVWGGKERSRPPHRSRSAPPLPRGAQARDEGPPAPGEAGGPPQAAPGPPIGSPYHPAAVGQLHAAQAQRRRDQAQGTSRLRPTGMSHTSTAIARAFAGALAAHQAGLGRRRSAARTGGSAARCCVVSRRVAPRSRSWPFSGRPAQVRADHRDRQRQATSPGRPRAAPPRRRTAGRWRRAAASSAPAHVWPKRASAASAAPGAMKVTPNGRPCSAKPAGSASAHQPSRLTKLVYSPSVALMR